MEELKKGDAFGEWALLDIGAKSEVSLFAKKDLVLLSLEVKEVTELIGPLRDHVLKKWVEERGAMYLFAATSRGWFAAYFYLVHIFSILY